MAQAPPAIDSSNNNHNTTADEGNQKQQMYTLLVGCFRRPERFPLANTWTALRGGSGAMHNEEQQQQQQSKRETTFYLSFNNQPHLSKATILLITVRHEHNNFK